MRTEVIEKPWFIFENSDRFFSIVDTHAWTMMFGTFFIWFIIAIIAGELEKDKGSKREQEFLDEILDNLKLSTFATAASMILVPVAIFLFDFIIPLSVISLFIAGFLGLVWLFRKGVARLIKRYKNEPSSK